MDFKELDLNLLKVFIEVYENRSILLASKKLFVSQPAVSHSIKKLELFLGGTLFVRKSRGVVPTTEGEQFYESCKVVFQNLNNSLNSFSQFTTLEKGYINIGSSSTIMRRLLLPFISYFSKKYPNVVIRVTDAVNTSLIKYLKRGEIDLAIMSGSVVETELFNISTLTTTTDCFIANSNFEKDFIKKADLSKYPIIVQKKPSSNRDYFDQVCLENNLHIVPKYEIGSFGLMTDFVEKKMGIAFTIKDFVQVDIDNGRVKEIKTDLDVKPREVLVLTNKGSVNSLATNKFIDKMKDFFKNN